MSLFSFLLLPPVLPEPELHKCNNMKREVYLLSLADVGQNVDEHAGVDEQENKDWKVEPKKFAHSTVEMTAPE